METPTKDRTKAFIKRQQERGLKRVNLWVPEQDIPRVHKYVERLRREAAKH